VLVGMGSMVAVSACDGIRSTRDTSLKDVSWSGHVVGSGTFGPVGGAALLAGVGNKGGSRDRGAGDLGDRSTAAPVGGATLLAGVDNMGGGSGDRGTGDLGDSSTAEGRWLRGVDRAVL